jgi:benzoylformate decarboxylase
MQPIYFPEPLIAPDTKIVQIDDDPWEIGKNFPVSAPIQGNIKIAVSELNRVLEERMTESTVKRASARAEAVHSQKEQMTRDFLQRAKQESEFVPISISRLMQELRDAIKPGTMIVDDCWSSSGFLRRTIDFTEPGSFQRARSGGSIGWGMSGCLGVKLAASDKPVVAVVGDGSAIWSIQSLWTASHYHIPVTYIICANASYCQVRLMKSIIMGDKGDCLGTMLEQPRIDFTQLSRAMGVPAQRVERPEDLKAALNNALDSKQTNLIEVYVESKA